jgi:hypothetical protein
MKILLVSNYIGNFHAGYHYLLTELAKHEKIVCYDNFDTRRKLLPLDFPVSKLNSFNYRFGRGWHVLSKKFSAAKRIKDLKRLSCDCDVALIASNEFFGQLNWHDAQFIKCPKVLYMADLHYRPHRNIPVIKKSGFDKILFVYKSNMDWWKRAVSGNVGWLPHSVNADVFKDYCEPKKYDVVSAGNLWRGAYPFRNLINDAFSGSSNIHYAFPKHPQQTMTRRIFNQDPAKNCCVYENYARFLNSSRLFVFDSSIHNYALAKYFEGMAAQTLVLAPTPKDASELGFEAGVHYVKISEKDFVEKTKFCLTHREDCLAITQAARGLMLERHSTVKRAEQLRSILHEV